jgi:capsular polysaccharide biosynthesis protein
MNNTWTKEQTIESVKKQKKVLYVVIPILFVLIAVLYFLFASWYQAETKLLIQMGHLSANFTEEDLSNFCLTYYNDLDVVFSIACFWSL